MKFITSIFLTALLSFVICLYMDWWAIAIAAFAVAVFIHQKPAKSFLTGFIALLLLWGILSWWIDIKNEHVLSHRMASLLPFGGSAFLMILVTALIGALVAGFASMAGSYLR
ncbi:MAG: hypothetical protein ABJB86_25085, partial [Bacteroidota bacterium]